MQAATIEMKKHVNIAREMFCDVFEDKIGKLPTLKAQRASTRLGPALQSKDDLGQQTASVTLRTVGSHVGLDLMTNTTDLNSDLF